MNRLIERALNEHEKNHPDERYMNDLATMDMLSNGKTSPSKPLAMHAGYELDGHPNRRQQYSDNFDHLIHPDEREIIDDEILEAAELSALLHHPDYIMEEAEERTETQDISRDVLLYLLSKYGVEEGYKPIMQELFKPMLSTLLDKVIDKETATRQVLAPAMVTRTPYHHDDYNKKIEMAFTSPVVEGFIKQNWKNELPKIFKRLQGGKDA
jgi:hypothetical protein